ncbi:uncharacterized protein BDZ99DRAFT_484736 [Mytilinidion resinicola]|uniref:BHLH domain-containing protein n=1 Tax=Mytilinidion resinicola TaxID=574789 RepID=A0A6A6Z4I5_9PEZI|nr:uncharacterized protein BDZ99DRAFT_484736 [Mytilinidion resinicola]KAF2815940.1 hypothetical protein BDZ99DRAFT_484736 [Mytilinidion resinicola]
MSAPFNDLIDFGELDIDNINFGDTVFEPDHSQDDTNHQSSNELADSLKAQHLQQFASPASHSNRHAPPSGLDQAQSARIGSDMSQANDFYDFNMSSFSQSTQAQVSFSAAQEPAFHSHTGVPPTPNSVEMHGDAARYLQQMDPQTRAFIEQRYQLRKEEAAFTPLVSPAVTPHDLRYQMPEYTTVPGSYFSPLTSPALRAQSQQERHAYQHSQYGTSGSSAGTSPVDLDVDMLGEAATSQPDAGRRLRSNKKAGNRSAAASARVRQSPIVKPSTRRKATLSSVIPPKEVSDLLEEVQRTKQTQSSFNTLPLPRSRDASEAESISPEPLSDMRPPPRPGSVTHSPAISAKGGDTFSPMHSAAQGLHPATPASLMRLQQSPGFSPNLSHHQEMSPLLEELRLPESATSSSRPSLSRIETQAQDEDQSTPRLPARKTPKLNPLSTPGSMSLSMAPSPLMSAISSPTSPVFAVNGARRIEAKGPRNSKKRNSTSSALVSPALRPKISPSIKPLLPDGATSDETHALLLASKSNYQNILDGTTVPGVNYPSSLSTNLTSKRTSHKIAEQGRRNRINTALLEMQTLLPSPHIKAKDAGDSKSSESNGSGGSVGVVKAAPAVQSNSSKAATVETAIEYIRKLQKAQQEKEEIISKKDEEVEALRRELARLRRGSSTSTPSLVEEPKQEADSGTEMVDAT